MLGYIFCRLWAHNWRYMYTNGNGRAVLHCKRCHKLWWDGP